MGLLEKIFGTHSQNELKRIYPIAGRIEAMDADMQKLTDEELRNKTKEFLLPFKFGAVSMAKKTNSRIVPFGISGDYKFRSKNLRVVIGKPINIEKMDLEEAPETKTTRIIILKLEQHGTIGIIVDEVREVVTLGTSQIEKVAHDNRDDSINFLTGVGKYNGELISLLDLNAVATEKENA